MRTNDPAAELAAFIHALPPRTARAYRDLAREVLASVSDALGLEGEELATQRASAAAAAADLAVEMLRKGGADERPLAARLCALASTVAGASASGGASSN